MPNIYTHDQYITNAASVTFSFHYVTAAPHTKVTGPYGNLSQ
jgi:hypothetical protein